MSEHVEMRPAFTWDCPGCGREHFARAVVPEIDPVKHKELGDEGFTDKEIAEFLATNADMPGRVKCKGCGREYRTVPFGAVAEDVELADGEGEEPATD